MLTLALAAALAPQLEVPADARPLDLGALPHRTAAVAGEPVYQLGWEGDHDWIAIVSGVLLSDGSAAILDGLARTLVVIDPQGSVRHVVGQEGEGPGEFKYPLSVTRMPGDTLVVEDDGNHRLNWFHDGVLLRDARYPDPAMINSYSARGWEGSEQVWTRWATPSPLPEGWTHDAVLGWTPGAAALDTVLTYRRFPSDPPSPSTRFRSVGRVGLTRGALITVWMNRPEFVRFPLDQGPPLHVRWDEESPTVTDSLWNEHVEQQRRRIAAADPGFRTPGLLERRVGDRDDVADPLPLIGEIHGDPLGRIWVSRWNAGGNGVQGTAGPFRVFGPDGVWLGWVELPGRMRILDIGSDRILAVQRDAFDVEAVVVLPLVSR